MRVLFFFIVLTLLVGCNKSGNYAIIETDFGTIKVLLYDSTPKHRDNFIKLAKEGFYDDLLFHRVINGFMIQGGDPDSKGAPMTQILGNGGPGYTLDAEIGAPHIKGALAAARTADQVNPQRKSSGSQFYIVQGKKVSPLELGQIEKRNGIKYNDAQKQAYQELGGAPFLDNQYTVFGEVVEGMEVIDKIANVRIGAENRPVQDVKMKIRME